MAGQTSSGKETNTRLRKWIAIAKKCKAIGEGSRKQQKEIRERQTDRGGKATEERKNHREHKYRLSGNTYLWTEEPSRGDLAAAAAGVFEECPALRNNSSSRGRSAADNLWHWKARKRSQSLVFPSCFLVIS